MTRPAKQRQVFRYAFNCAKLDGHSDQAAAQIATAALHGHETPPGRAPSPPSVLMGNQDDDVESGEQADGLTTDEVENLVRQVVRDELQKILSETQGDQDEQQAANQHQPVFRQQTGVAGPGVRVDRQEQSAPQPPGIIFQ